MPNTTFIELPQNYSFRATVYSHGWCELSPFALDTECWTLSCVVTAAGSPIAADISSNGRKLRVDLDDPSADPGEILPSIRHILRLDDDLTGFYESIGNIETLDWVKTKFAGRLLRSETVFEDLVKTICTTNCSWSLTKIMVSNLVSKLGMPSAGGKRAFPSVEAMAAAGLDFYRDEMRAGYRSQYFVELAEAVAAGGLDPEAWLASDLPTPELKKEIKKVKGVGDYAAENLLKLIGRYDGLALDSWLRSQFYRKHNHEEKCPDKRIEDHYKKFKEWRGLVIWCDMTEKWID